jgi:hypothetical protein
VILGVALLGAGFAILRTFGPRYRVGRLLAVTPVVTVAQALGLAESNPRYLAIQGRIDAEAEFEDDAHRPLVYRRARIQRRRRNAWETVDQHVEAVDFSVREGLDPIAIDHAALDDGLIVIPRESVGVAAEVRDRVPAEIPDDTPIRLRVDLVSSVEHALVLGVPRRLSPEGPVMMTAGGGRPLILTTLERSEAMRVLTEGGERRPLLAAIALAAGVVALGIGLIWALLAALTGTASAASPAPSQVVGGDPRSSGQGPGLVGDPLVAIGLVLAIGLVAVAATLIYLRLTGGRQG